MKATRLVIIGLVGALLFWINDMLTSFLVSFLNAGEQVIDPFWGFVIAILFFIAELYTIGWIITKVPSIAGFFGA